jgi:hypothetical protein
MPTLANAKVESSADLLADGALDATVGNGFEGVLIDSGDPFVAQVHFWLLPVFCPVIMEHFVAAELQSIPVAVVILLKFFQDHWDHGERKLT